MGHSVFNASNRGFAGAVNQGFKAARTSTCVLLLNPDTVLKIGQFEPWRIVSQIRRSGPRPGVLAGADGADQTEFHFRRLPTAAVLAFEVLGVNRLVARQSGESRLPAGPRGTQIEQPAGAFLMIRRASLGASSAASTRAFIPSGSKTWISANACATLVGA